MNNAPEDKPSFKSQLPGIIIGLGTVAATFWLFLNEYWPVEELNTIQASIFFDHYSPEVSFMFTWLILLAPFVAIKFFWKKLKSKQA